jgi:hypothetical protein
LRTLDRGGVGVGVGDTAEEEADEETAGAAVL